MVVPGSLTSRTKSSLATSCHTPDRASNAQRSRRLPCGISIRLQGGVGESDSEDARPAGSVLGRSCLAPALAPPKLVYTLRPAGSALVNHVSFELDGKLLTADAEGWVTVWSLRSWRIETVWQAHEEPGDVHVDSSGAHTTESRAAGQRESTGTGGALWTEPIGRDAAGRDLILS